jgi:hypothetical protein
MSYLQIELGGKKRGLKFNQMAIEIMSTTNDTTTATGFLYSMIYAGLKGNSYVKREEADYTFEDVCDWIDVMPNRDEVTAEIILALTNTQIWKDLTTIKEDASDDKKKVEEKLPITT